ncbi:MAG: hypothetical protein GF308_05735 [Candidatus Heimdallarchaeota archaeon]|nr:hypothetical protein [Candidatus Heimdallarchaeota archaeon]
MIHKIIVIDQRTTIGQPLYDDGTIVLETELLTGFISALSAFAQCLGEEAIEFQGADLGNSRFSLISRDHLTYAIFQDIFDNDPFSRIMLKEIIDIYHDELVQINLASEYLQESMINEIASLLETKSFPVSILKDFNREIETILSESSLQFDLLFLGSITKGIITVWRRPINPRIMQLFLDIVSKIPLDMNWLAQGKTNSFTPAIEPQLSELETWIIKRISVTQFFIAGRATTKEIVLKDDLTEICSVTIEKIIEVIEKALEQEWSKRGI